MCIESDMIHLFQWFHSISHDLQMHITKTLCIRTTLQDGFDECDLMHNHVKCMKCEQKRFELDLII